MTDPKQDPGEYGRRAIAYAERQCAQGPREMVGMCKRQVRMAFRVTISRSLDAAEAWREAVHKHHAPDPNQIPAGVPIFWTGGSAGHGHVAISDVTAGWCWSTDIARPGYFDRVHITEIAQSWGLKLVGWTEDLDGVRVYTPPKPKPSYGGAVDDALDDLAIAKSRGRRKRIKAVIALIRRTLKLGGKK